MSEKKEMRIANVPKLPDLHTAKVSSLEMCPEYWTPENEGEFKVGVIVDLVEAKYLDDNTGDEILLPCIVMLAQNKDGSFGAVKNGSKRLYASVQELIISGAILYDETPVRIEFKGKVKNKSNAFKSDTWSIKKINI